MICALHNFPIDIGAVVANMHSSRAVLRLNENPIGDGNVRTQRRFSMWPYTKDECRWLDGKADPAAPAEPPEITPEFIDHHLLKARQLRAEATAAMARRVVSAIARGLGRARGAAGPDPDHDAVTVIAHELKTPLTSIRSLSEVLRHNPDVPLDERNRFLDAILDESDRLNRAINTVLDTVTAHVETAPGGPRRPASTAA